MNTDNTRRLLEAVKQVQLANRKSLLTDEREKRAIRKALS